MIGWGGGDVDAAAGTPEAFEIVVVALALGEGMHEESAVVEQNPFGAFAAFAMNRADSVFAQLFLDGVDNGRDLRSAKTGAEQEGFGEGPESGEIQNGDGFGFFVLRGVDCPAQLWTERISGHDRGPVS